MFKKLFEPLTINGVLLPNRTVVPAMVSCYCAEDGTATEQYIAFHEARARGGWGMIITEDYAVDKRGKAYRYLAGLWSDDQIASHRELTRRVHQYDAKILAQIYHCGRKTKSAITGSLPVAPSAIPNLKGVEMPVELTLEEIAELVEKFGDAAVRAREAGFDGVEIHGAHGYLIGQFLSPSSNFRTDKYGGPFMNRLRFPLEIIANIRKKVGPDFLVGYRISADEKIMGGYTIEDTKTIAPIIEKAGVDFIDVSAGTGDGYWIIPPASTPSAWLAAATGEIRKTVSVPVITVSRINDPLVAEQVLASGNADLVAMGRASLIDADMPNKAREGRLDDIRKCIGCNVGCTGGIYANVPITCVLNPELSREAEGDVQPAATPRKVAVVGAGPAGLEAAWTAARAGHHVTVYEKSGRAGGQFRFAAAVPCKGDIAAFINWQVTQLERLGVPIIYNTEVDADLLRRDPPDLVIVATGSVPLKPAIPGIDKKHVIHAVDLLGGKIIVGTHNVVVGGGQTGSGSALYLGLLSKNALERRVTVIEKGPDIATEDNLHNKLALIDNLASARVRVITNSEVVEIRDDCVVVKGETEELIPADTVVIAVGSVSDNALADSLKKAGFTVQVIGDAASVRQVRDATQEGYAAGKNIG